ncbi:MAG: transposase [Thermomicrobia bacterium]|nr:transposase [Thermomicrobia bacterium]
MHTLPPAMILLLRPFAPRFSKRVWAHVQILLMGAILTPAQRTVTAALRVVGLGQTPHFQRYHRVLNRASWSALAVSRVLLRLLVAAFVADGPLVVGVDETLERRTGAQIAAKGVYRDAVRTSHSHFVKATGLRWVSLMLLAPIPWAQRVWALPFLTALAPSERYDAERGRRHKALTDWAWQLLLVVRRWWPERAIVAVADSGYAAIRLLARCSALPQPITVVTRLRLDAALYEPAPPRVPGQIGRPRQKGKRLPTLAARASDPATVWQAITVADWYGKGERTVALVSETAIWYHTGLPPVPIRWVLIRDSQGKFATQALLCTDLTATPQQIIAWFVRRWQMETTFEEVRRHLGVETQRQWTDMAIRRTTPALLGLFSLVTLLAHPQLIAHPGPLRQAAWYRKRTPTFADALAWVRREIWAQETFCMSSEGAEMVKVPRALVERLTETLCYVA